MHWRLATLGLLLASIACAEDDMRVLTIDSDASRVDFDVSVLWMVKRRGQFHRLEGQALIDGDVVSIDVRLPSESATMKSRDHEETLKSPDYFDVEKHPWIRFRSKPFAIDGSTTRVRGWLSLRGVERVVEFDILASPCLRKRPVRKCAIAVSGSVRRSEFGMTANRRTLADRVGLSISAVVNEMPPAPP